MAYSWRHQGLGLSYDDEPQQTPTHTDNFSVPSLSRLLRDSSQPGQLSSRRHSSVDESLYSSRPDSLLQLARRPVSIHSPQLGQHQEQDEWSINALGISTDLEIRDLDQNPHGETPILDHDMAQQDPALSPLPPLPLFSFPSANKTSTSIKPRPKVDRSATSYHTAQYSMSNYDEEDDIEPAENRYPTPTSSRSSPVKPSPTKSNGTESVRYSPTKALRKSQAQAIEKNSSYFTWRKAIETGATRMGSVAMVGGLISPASSNAGALAALNGQTKLGTTAISRGYSSDSENDDDMFSESASPTTGTPAEGSRHVEELMEELRGVSTELASSIRREMDLEDELEHYRNEPVMQDPSRRTSDYFSESSSSSMKLPTADTRSKIESLETMRRKVEQEKARLRLAMAEKAENDLIQRRALEMHIQSLEEQLQGQTHHEEALASTSDLEVALEDVRQHLDDERLLKTRAEQLLSQLQTQHEACVNERDNLKEETIPRLRARIEGLESETTDMQKLQYENTQLQQELQMMRSENQTLIEARRLQLDQTQRFRSIVEEEEFVPMSPLASPRAGNGVSRSQSIARTRSIKINRTNSVLNSPNPAAGGQQWSTESFKDVEDQRDALHMTLRTLLLRQDVLNRQHAKQLRVLQAERDEALRGLPLSNSVSQEVQRMRNDFLQLRQRADEASELKWQCEKGLSGLRMDLERTEQETHSVQQHAAAVTRSKDVQAQAAQKIAQIEVCLRAAEEDVISSQGLFEDALAKEEEHVRRLKEAELEKRTRGVTRMANKGHKQESPLAKPTKALREKLKGDGDGGKMESANMTASVVKLEDLVQKAEGEVQELMVRLNEVHVEMSGLSA